MNAVAKTRNCHMSARKMRLVADLVRGLPVEDALNVLKYSKQEASLWIEKCLLSAIANWEYTVQEKHGLSEEIDDYDAYISEIRVDEGAFLKRFRPAPHGRAHRIRKRTCHLILEIDNRIYLPFEEPGAEEDEEYEDDIDEVEEEEELVEAEEEVTENQDN